LQKKRTSQKITAAKRPRTKNGATAADAAACLETKTEFAAEWEKGRMQIVRIGK